jgi:hypothetical protein
MPTFTPQLSTPRAVFCAVVSLSATMLLPRAIPAQPSQRTRVSPLFEVFGTYSKPPLASAVREAYAAGGSLRAGGGLGIAVGVLLNSRVEVAAFYEAATASLSGTSLSDGRKSFGRNTIGMRIEAPVADLGEDFHLLISGSAFHQALEEVSFPILITPNSVTFRNLTQRALGGRIEAGVEHRGFIGTTWYATAGLTMAGAGSGLWKEDFITPSGLGFAPIVTVGLRTRQW